MWGQGAIYYKKKKNQQMLKMMTTGYGQTKVLLNKKKKGANILLTELKLPKKSLLSQYYKPPKTKNKTNVGKQKQRNSPQKKTQEQKKVEQKVIFINTGVESKLSEKEWNDCLAVYDKIEKQIQKEMDDIWKSAKDRLRVRDKQGAESLLYEKKLLGKQLQLLNLSKVHKKRPPKIRYQNSIQ
ncbi:hypothetical protein M0813_27525 [Anaeramoeba flamelloides]|uniref:Uncharacterized protein n=1 Tax=Anaeramoeba flamelloides TaxID=1746091 RepID=A0ABQ8XX75_9EUKA|nr:hypothetical protein M0813_27525 [Anaeramoeba flamelloides]